MRDVSPFFGDEFSLLPEDYIAAGAEPPLAPLSQLSPVGDSGIHLPVPDRGGMGDAMMGQGQVPGPTPPPMPNDPGAGAMLPVQPGPPEAGMPPPAGESPALPPVLGGPLGEPHPLAAPEDDEDMLAAIMQAVLGGQGGPA